MEDWPPNVHALYESKQDEEDKEEEVHEKEEENEDVDEKEEESEDEEEAIEVEEVVVDHYFQTSNLNKEELAKDEERGEVAFGHYSHNLDSKIEVEDKIGESMEADVVGKIMKEEEDGPQHLELNGEYAVKMEGPKFGSGEPVKMGEETEKGEELVVMMVLRVTRMMVYPQPPPEPPNSKVAITATAEMSAEMMVAK